MLERRSEEEIKFKIEIEQDLLLNEALNIESTLVDSCLCSLKTER
jgi:hypothetical protein